MGNQNYEIPNGADLTKYNNVLIWCRLFRSYLAVPNYYPSKKPKLDIFSLVETNESSNC